jgi:hypothetical protein
LGNRGQLLQTSLELLATITPERAHHITRQALGVNARRNGLEPEYITMHHGDMLLAIDQVAEDVHAKVAESRGQVRCALQTYLARRGL